MTVSGYLLIDGIQRQIEDARAAVLRSDDEMEAYFAGRRRHAAACEAAGLDPILCASLGMNLDPEVVDD